MGSSELKCFCMLLLLLLLLLFSVSTSRSSDEVVTVDVHETKGLIGSGHRYLDVRTVEEFTEGQLENSLNVPYLFFTPQGRVKNPDFLEQVSNICSKDDQILVGCQSGVRSLNATEDLLNAIENINVSLVQSDYCKLEKLDGEHYQVWKRKVYLTLQLKDVDHVRLKEEPSVPDTRSTAAINAATKLQAKWRRKNSICRLLILNAMEDSLAKSYSKKEFARNIWESVE